MSVRRMLPFIFINIIVSATVVFLILYFFGEREGGGESIAEATAVLATVPVIGSEPTSESSQPEATQSNEDGQTTHTVQPGDTLGSISLQYDVPLDDIMAANGITDPNFLQANQVLIIPIGGLPTATPEPTATATPNVAPSPIATEPPAEGEVIIEITEVIGLGSLADEAVNVVNRGSRSVALLDWELSDAEGTVYTFGQVTLFGNDASILVHTETGQDRASDLFWGLEQPVWESGETVTLTDNEGTVRATFTIP